MSAFLQYPDLNIEIVCQGGHTKVRDLSTGEEREMATSSADFDGLDSDQTDTGEQHTGSQKT